MKTTKLIFPIAQGDVLIKRVDSLPATASKAKPVDGQFIVTHSETGHHHVADATNVTMYDVPDSPLVGYLRLEDACQDIGGVDIVHTRPWDTHETWRLLGRPGDVFEIRRQREWAPEGWRRVAD